MAWTFLACDLIDGTVLDEVPLRIGGQADRRLMGVGTADLELPVRDEACPPNWQELILPWRTLIVAVDDRARIGWAGIPTKRTRGVDPVVSYPAVTVEGYLDHRYVPSLEFVGQDQTSIIATALLDIANDSGINLDIDAPFSGVPRDRTYHDDESGRVLKRLQELAEVQDGFEWTIEVEWADTSQTAVRKVARTGYPTLGHVTDTPDLTFELPGQITHFNLDEDWTSGSAATHTRALGDGEGASRLMSAPVIDTEREATGWPRLEERRSYDGVTVQSTIDAYADAMAAEMFGGTELVEITVRADQAPEFGTYFLGDSARILITADTVPIPATNGVEAGLDTVWRVVGWSIDTAGDSVFPVLARVTEA